MHTTGGIGTDVTSGAAAGTAVAGAGSASAGGSVCSGVLEVVAGKGFTVVVSATVLVVVVDDATAPEEGSISAGESDSAPHADTLPTRITAIAAPKRRRFILQTPKSWEAIRLRIGPDAPLLHIL
jgi:hypothetical protein